MSPAVNSTSAGSTNSSSSSNRQERRADLIWRVSYMNTLPDIPFDGKCISYPFENDRFSDYRPTSMDLTRKFDLLTEPDLGVRIDLVKAAAGSYVADSDTGLAPEDERLLEDDPLSVSGEKGSHAAKKRRVPWLRRTQYLGGDLQRMGTQTELGETRVGRRFFAQGEREDVQLYKDTESQVQAIQRTFEMAQQPISATHHNRPGVTPVEVLPVFPDFDMWQFPAAQVLFDTDPAPANSQTESGGVDRLSQGMIRGLQDDQGEQFVAYFLPTESTLKKRKKDVEEGVDYDPSEEYDYEVVREYNWNVRAPPERQGTGGRGEIGFSFIFHGDRVVYDELDTRVRLSRRKKPSAANVRSRLVVRFRPFTDNEIATQKNRLAVLDSVNLQEQADNDEDIEDNLSNNGNAEKSASPSEKSASNSESSEGSSSSSESDTND